jgi:hypothetical protein
MVYLYCTLPQGEPGACWELSGLKESLPSGGHVCTRKNARIKKLHHTQVRILHGVPICGLFCAWT